MSECSNVEAHTPSPEGYVAWQAWADAMLKARWSQGRCRDCGLYAIWTPPYQGEPLPTRQQWASACLTCAMLDAGPHWGNNGGTGAALAGGEDRDGR
jgi:hypothetical protein